MSASYSFKVSLQFHPQTVFKKLELAFLAANKFEIRISKPETNSNTK